MPLLAIPMLILFKYGKQRHYFSDFIAYRTKPKVYSAMDPDRKLNQAYLPAEDE